MMRASGHGVGAVTGRLWRIAFLTASGAVGASCHADAALYDWSDSDSGSYSRPAPAVQTRRQKARHQAKTTEAPHKEATKPQGPVIIAISIEKQNLKIYDANGFFAEAPVSTGMKGHPTPMGVFSVIQKQKLHHSNIYSGAPMPYMQRITWSGIAIHAGVLPGYPASHGCIRMPMAFAVKMWNWTKMGARVVVTPGEITPPLSFSHSLLVAQKVAPQPAGEPQADAPAPKTDKAPDAGISDPSAISAASLELRSTVGHGNGATQIMREPPASTSLRDQTHTADASGESNRSATMNDATPAGRSSSAHQQAAAPTDGAPPAAGRAGSANATEVAKPDAAKSETAKSEAEADDAKPAATISTDHTADSKPSETDAAEAKPADTKSAETKPPSSAPDTEAKRAENPADPRAEASTANAAKANEKSGDSPKAVTDSGGNAADANKDQTRLPDTAKPAVAAAPKRAGQIAVLISRKDQKIYLRQNFEPLFDAPVTIARSDRPLGTHVFTAQIDKNDANVVHWSVVSMPAPRHITRDEDETSSRRRKMAGAIEAKQVPAPDSPAEALDRLTIPAEVMARMTDVLSTGASIIVSDQGINQGETGEGTDFIVSLR